MDKSFVLQYYKACPGYKRFFIAWCRIGNDPDQCPTEDEWEKILNNSKKEQEYVTPPLSELIELFPDIVKVAKKKLQELRDEYDKEHATCNLRLNILLANAETTNPLLLQELNVKAFAPLDDIELDMKHWERIIRIHEWKRKPPEDGTITDIDIARAKDFPLTELVQVNKAGFANCPFHNEKTPSCKIYKKGNRFHCFGCLADGDVIDYVMKQNDIDFITAVKKILNK